MRTRRDFAAFTAGALASKLVLPLAARAEPVHPDVAFIAFAARYPAILAAYNAYTGPDHTPEIKALEAEVIGTWNICMEAEPRTLQGLLAKARLVLVEAAGRDGEEMEADNPEDRMARSLVHDLLRLAGEA